MKGDPVSVVRCTECGKNALGNLVQQVISTVGMQPIQTLSSEYCFLKDGYIALLSISVFMLGTVHWVI